MKVGESGRASEREGGKEGNRLKRWGAEGRCILAAVYSLSLRSGELSQIQTVDLLVRWL